MLVRSYQPSDTHIRVLNYYLTTVFLKLNKTAKVYTSATFSDIYLILVNIHLSRLCCYFAFAINVFVGVKTIVCVTSEDKDTHHVDINGFVASFLKIFQARPIDNIIRPPTGQSIRISIMLPLRRLTDIFGLFNLSHSTCVKVVEIFRLIIEQYFLNSIFTRINKSS